MKATALTSIGIALLLAGCGSGSGPARMRASTPQVPQLRSLEQLRATFNAHETVPRLVVLVAPT